MYPYIYPYTYIYPYIYIYTHTHVYISIWRTEHGGGRHGTDNPQAGAAGGIFLEECFKIVCSCKRRVRYPCLWFRL